MTSAKRTEGERIAFKYEYLAGGHDELVADIDRAIRRAQAKAWEEGFDYCCVYQFGRSDNPYRRKR